jgi:hypothetical protein
MTHTLETSGGREVRLKQHVTPVRTDTTLALWSDGTLRAFPVDIDGLIDDDTAEELAHLGLLVGKEDRDAVTVAMRASAGQLFEQGRAAAAHIVTSASGEVLEMGSRTVLLAGTGAGLVVDRLDDAMPGLAKETASWRRGGRLIESALLSFARPAGYERIVLVQRPLWPVGSRGQLITMVRNLSLSVRTGGEFWGLHDPQWPGSGLVDTVNRALGSSGYSVAARISRLTGRRQLVLLRDDGVAPLEIEVIEQAFSPAVSWLATCFAVNGGWDELDGFDERLNQVPMDDRRTDPVWIRARRTGGGGS